jgi:hypothetical protein
VDWIGLVQDGNRWRAPVNSVLNLRVPGNAGKLSSGPTYSGLSNSAQLHRVSLLVSLILVLLQPGKTQFAVQLNNNNNIILIIIWGAKGKD